MGFASTVSSSTPFLVIPGGYNRNSPSFYSADTTAVSSAIIATGFWAGSGEKSRGGNGAQMKLGDILIHRASTDSATPGRVTMHSVISATANVASTVASSGYNAAYDVTVSSAT